jgi:hypothetical protein
MGIHSQQPDDDDDADDDDLYSEITRYTISPFMLEKRARTITTEYGRAQNHRLAAERRP